MSHFLVVLSRVQTLMNVHGQISYELTFNQFNKINLNHHVLKTLQKYSGSDERLPILLSVSLRLLQHLQGQQQTAVLNCSHQFCILIKKKATERIEKVSGKK